MKMRKLPKAHSWEAYIGCTPELGCHVIARRPSKGGDIATMIGEDHTTNAAHAKLVAAAPDLLESLEILLKQWDSVPDSVQVPDEINNDTTWAAVRAAIAKARGV